MELSNIDIQMLFVGTLIPLIVIALAIVFIRQKIEIKQVEKTLHDYRGHCLDMDNYNTKLINEAAEAKKKLIDALSQKTRATDYAKDCEEKLKAYVAENKKQSDTIKHLNSVNRIQSNGLVMWMEEWEKLKFKCDAKEALLKKCEDQLRINSVKETIVFKKDAKVKPYYYDGKNKLCIKKFCFAGSTACRKQCNKNIGYGKTSKGRYVKCQTLNDSLNEK